jgi:hypothetical protein
MKGKIMEGSYKKLHLGSLSRETSWSGLHSTVGGRVKKTHACIDLSKRNKGPTMLRGSTKHSRRPQETPASSDLLGDYMEMAMGGMQLSD